MQAMKKKIREIIKAYRHPEGITRKEAGGLLAALFVRELREAVRGSKN